METNNPQENELRDESMLGFSGLLEELLEPFDVFSSADDACTTQVESIRLDMPVQLQARVDDAGQVVIGIIPPLYRVSTSFDPVFHRVAFTCEINR